jgi:ABC-2 type transport system permease protein
VFPSINAEFVKLWKRPATWFLAGAFVIVILLFNDLFSDIAVHRMPRDDVDLPGFRSQLLFQNFSWAALGVVASIGGPIALILGALISGSEYGWSTFKTILTLRPSRENIISGKIVSLGLLTGIFVVLGWIGAAIGSLIVSVLNSSTIAMPSASSVIEGLAAGWLIAFVWGGVGLALGLIFRSTAMPIGFGLIWGLAAENIIGGLGGTVHFFRTVQRFLIGPNAATLANSVGISRFTGDVGVQLSTTHAIAVLLSYLIVLLLIATQLFRTRDIT